MANGKPSIINFKKLALDVPSLAAAVPKMEEILEKQGLKEAYKLDKTGSRDDQAPII